MNASQNEALRLAQAFIRCPSVTNEPNLEITNCIRVELEKLGFETLTWDYQDQHGTQKYALEARRLPTGSAKSESAGGAKSKPGIAFFCHSDVVSVDGWNCPWGEPFSADIAEGRLWGRGACDMKGPLAAALAAISCLPAEEQTAPIHVFITGDEECGMQGAGLLARNSDYFQEVVTAQGIGIITEPTSLTVVNSHKGICHLEVASEGVAAHSSTRDGLNANWNLIPYLQYLSQVHQRLLTEPKWLNERFCPSDLSMNIVLKNQPCMSNITVGQSTCEIFFRPMPDTAWETLIEELLSVAEQSGLRVKSSLSLPPVATAPERDSLTQILRRLQQTQAHCVSYATDACCLDALADKIVLGPGSIEQAHRPDEYIDIAELGQGVAVYEDLLRHFAGSS